MSPSFFALFMAAVVADADATAIETLPGRALTEAQEAAFDPGDGKISAFWWDLQSGAEIKMLPSTHSMKDGRDTWMSDKDAHLVVRVAHGRRGLYLWLEARDDEWSPIFAEAKYDWAYDGVELMFDGHSTAEIRACGKKCRLAKLQDVALTNATRQIQMWTDPRQDRLNYFYPEDGAWQEHSSSVAEAKQRHDGLAIDRAASGGVRRAECFLPWSQLGWKDGPPKPGTRLGFSVSYNDNDQRRDNPYQISTLRWIGGGNPWAGVQHWGDILLQ